LKILHITASYKPAFIYGGPIYSVAALCEALIKTEVGSPQSEGIDGKTKVESRKSEVGSPQSEVVDGKTKVESRETDNRRPKFEASVTVYTTLANGKEELPYQNGEEKIVEGVSVKYFKRITKDHSHFSPSLLWHLWKNAKHYHVIHIHAWWNLVSMGAVFICLIKRIKPIVSPRGMLGDYTFSRGKKIFHLLFGKYFLRKCDFHATTTMEADEIVKRVFGDKEKVNILDLMEGVVPSSTFRMKSGEGKERLLKRIFVIHNIVKVPKELPIDTRKFDGTLNLIFLSRIHHKKGIELLLDALSTIKFPFKLTIVGEGEVDYVKSLKGKVESLKLAEQIDWFGAVYGDQKFQLLANHDLFILPSYNENFANVVIEAIAVNTPVFIANKVGLSKFVAKNNLGVVCQLKPKDIANRLTVYFDRMQNNKSIKINNFNISNTKGFYKDLYERIY
jgi:glycosyltransferase involved in cell wall biosynthesis